MAEGGEIFYEKKLKDGNTFQVVERDTSGMRGVQDKYTMLIVDSKGKVVKNWGSHPSLSGAKKFGERFDDGGYMAEGGEIKSYNGKKYKEEFSGSNRWLEVDGKYEMTSEEHENEAFKANNKGDYELRDIHKRIAKSLSEDPIMLKNGGYMAEGGKLTNYKTSVIYYPSQEVVVYTEIEGVHKSILSRPYTEANKEYAIDFAKKTAEKNKGIYKGYYDISDALKMADGGYMAKGGEIKVGDLVKHKKYGWIMKVDKIEDGKYYLENDKRGVSISGKAGNNGSYGKSDIEKYAKGGAIENQYESRTAEDIWDSYTKEQRLHFLYDHAEEINEYKGLKDESENPWFNKSYKSEWNMLDKDVQNRFANHVRGGQYAKGGNVYSSDNAYLVEIYKNGQKVDRKIVRAKNKAEARVIFEERYGDNMEIEIVEAPSKYAKGGMIEHNLMIGDKIIQNADNIVVVENEGKKYVVNLNTGKRWSDTEWWNLSNRTAGKFQKMSEGGETEDEGVDLFEDYEDQPKEVSDLLETLDVEDYNYDTLNDLLSKMKKIGYTFEFGLDAEPYDLRKIGQRGKSEFYAKGGEISIYNLRKGDKVKTRKGDIETIVRKTGSGSYETIENDYSHSPESLEFVSRPSRKMAEGGEVFYTEKHKND
jgi:hypothetical protein